MQTIQPRKSYPLEKGNLLSLGNADTVEIACLSGQVWITQDNDVRDVVLDGGERFTSDRDAKVLVYALRPTMLSLSSSEAPAGNGFWSSIARKLRNNGVLRLLSTTRESPQYALD